MDPYSWIILGLILLCLLLSAMFSGTETAFTAASRAFISRRAQEGDIRARKLAKLRERKDRVVAAILVGNNFVNTTATALASGLLITWFGEGGVVYASLAMTVLLVIFSEVLPKTYALQHPERTAMNATPLLTFMMRLFGPLATAINKLVAFTLKLFGVKPPDTESAALSEDELLGAIDLLGVGAQGEADIAARQERRMLRGVLALDDLAVDDVMTHRSRINALDADDPTEKNVLSLLSSPHTRMPLWRDAGEDVIGILDAESVLRAFWAAGGDASRIDLPSLAMPATFVPDTRLLRNQLQEFRNAHLQMSLVVDEYGSVKGLVTLEDIIEVVVGPIAERGEAITPMESADGTVDVRGDVRVRDLNRELEWSLPEDEAVTLGGLAVAMFGGVPPLGKEIIIGDYRASVLERRGLRIDRIAIRKIPAAPLEQA